MRRNKWITCLALLFAAYAFFSANYKELKDSGISPAEGVDSAKKIVNELTAPLTAKREQSPLPPARNKPVEPVKPVLTLKDIIIGSGEKLACGQKATIRYALYLPDNKLLESIPSASIVVGEKHYIQGLEQGIIGMQKGGTRLLMIPSSLAYDDPRFSRAVPKGASIRAEVALQEIAADAAEKVDCR